MTEIWESSFKEKQAMWGLKPSDTAIETLDLFQKNNLHKILIPGYGYGRNAKVFSEKGFDVTGIEISKTAIELAKKHYGEQVSVFHGPVSDMPFDDELYDGIFCYALIHLLDEDERLKLIEDCSNQLKPQGLMVFVALSTNDHQFGKGEKISENRFLTPHKVKLFFYNSDSVKREFGKYGLVEAKEINEPAKPEANRPSQKFWKVTCEK